VLAGFVDHLVHAAPDIAAEVSRHAEDFDRELGEPPLESSAPDAAIDDEITRRFPDSSRPVEAALRAEALRRATVQELTDEIIRRSRIGHA